MEKYLVKFHQNEIMNYNWSEKRPIVKRIFEESYELPKELVLEQVKEFIDVPKRRLQNYHDLDNDLRHCLNEKEIDIFIEKNNRIYDFWKMLKPRIEEWIVLYSNREDSNFKHFTIDLEELSWNNHTWDTPEDLDKAYIEISLCH